MPEFQTGIYRHYNNDKLYLATGLERGKGVHEGIICVHYHALYPGEDLPFSRNLEGRDGFFEVVRRDNSDPREFHELPVPRFSLVNELPAEKLQLLLPGSLVNRISNPSSKPYKVVEIFRTSGSTIFVNLRHWEDLATETLPLEIFFQIFEKVSK